MTREPTSFVYVTYIRATPERVFEAITKPEIARRYWAHENVSDWTPGSQWEHVRANGDRTVELVGEVVEHTPPRRLVITWVNASQAEDPAKDSRVSFDFVPFDGMVQLTVTHDELEAGQRHGVRDQQRMAPRALEPQILPRNRSGDRRLREADRCRADA